MFATKIWLASALTVTAIFTASAVYKSYSDLHEAKQIQEHFEIITDIKTLLAKQYNKNPNDITRDEIIAYLPKGGNWDKVLLLDRNQDSTLSEDELVNNDGEIIINEDEKVKLFALKAKLNDTLNTASMSASNGTYTVNIAHNKTIKQKDKTVEDSLEKAIYYATQELIYGTETNYSSVVTNMVDNFTPHNDIYHDLSDIGLSTDSETIKKEKYFKSLLKSRLEKSLTPIESKLYTLLKDEL
jgi:hypothetical protein